MRPAVTQQTKAEEAEEIKLPPRQFIDRMRVLSDGTLSFLVSCDSPTLQQYHEQVIKKNYLVYGEDRERPVYRENGTLLVPSREDERWKHFLCDGRDRSPIKKVFSRGRALRGRIETLLQTSPQTASSEHFTTLFHSITAHASLLIDTLAPGIAENSLKEMLQGVQRFSARQKERILNDLNYPLEEKSYLNAIYEGLLRLRLADAHGVLSNESLRHFCCSVGYLDRTDLCPSPYEDIEHVRRLVHCDRVEWRDPAQAWFNVANADLTHSNACKRRQQAQTLLLREVGSNDKLRASVYSEMLGAALDFNEAHRRLRTQVFRFAEEWFHERGQDPLFAAPPAGCGRSLSLDEIDRLFRAVEFYQY